MGRILALWDEIWFRPQSPLPMAVYRILFGLLVIWDLILLWPNIDTFFGADGIISWQTASQYLAPYGFTVLPYLPQTSQALAVFFAVILIAAISLTLGLFTRVSAFVVLFGLLSLANRDPLIFNSGDILLRLGAYYLMFSNAGKTLSLDCLLKNGKIVDPSEWNGSPWAQRLLQFQMILIYFCAFWSKAASELWLNGTALYYVLHFVEFTRVPIKFLADNLFLCQLLTWYAMLAELSMFTLIWFKKLRYVALLSMIAMHLGVEVTMNIPIFEWLMICSLVVFVYPEDLEKILQRFKKLRSVDAVVDGSR